MIFISLTCVAMVCVTPPVEVPPKEARHTSMETHVKQIEIICTKEAPRRHQGATKESLSRHQGALSPMEATKEAPRSHQGVTK